MPSPLTDSLAINFRWRRRRAQFEARTGVTRRGDTFTLTAQHRRIGIRLRGEPPIGWISIRYHAEVAGLANVAAHLLVERTNGVIERHQLRIHPAGRTRDVVLLPVDTESLYLGLDQPGELTASKLAITQLGELWLGTNTLNLAARATIKAPQGAKSEVNRVLLDGKDVQTVKHAALNLARGQLDRSYATWVAQHDSHTAEELAQLTKEAESWTDPPLITVIVDGRAGEPNQLGQTLRSIMQQAYPHWRAVVFTAQDRNQLAGRAALVDDRIQLNGLEPDPATTHLCYVPAGDLLSPRALHWLAAEAHANPEALLIYSDEDQIDTDGSRSQPLMKPRWDPDLAESMDYTARLGIYQMSAAGWLAEFNNLSSISWSSLHNAVLGRSGSSLDATARDSLVCHVPRVAYHRAANSPCSLPDAHHRNSSASAAFADPDPWPEVSAVICTRDQPDFVKMSLAGFLDQTDYPDLEVIIVDNGTVDADALAELDRRSQDPRVRVIAHDAPFNFSALNNLGAREATGSMLALLNNDIEVTDPSWLKTMVRHAMRDDVGAVGARLDYPDGSVQHAGVTVGVGGVAGHESKHLRLDLPNDLPPMRVISRREVSAVTAAAMVIPTGVFHQVGGLDEENLAVAFNDIDLCLRIRAAGYRILYEPAARLIHHESVSRGPDTDPVAAARFASEIAYMRDRWGDELTGEDPFHSPNLAIDREDGSLAFPPRF